MHEQRQAAVGVGEDRVVQQRGVGARRGELGGQPLASTRRPRRRAARSEALVRSSQCIEHATAARARAPRRAARRDRARRRSPSWTCRPTPCAVRAAGVRAVAAVIRRRLGRRALGWQRRSRRGRRPRSPRSSASRSPVGRIKPGARSVDQLLHAGVLADEHRHAAGERLGGRVGEAVLVGWMHAQARAAQVAQRIARADEMRGSSAQARSTKRRMPRVPQPPTSGRRRSGCGRRRTASISSGTPLCTERLPT